MGKSATSLPDWAGPWGPLVKQSQISLPDALPGVPLFLLGGGWVCVAALRSKRRCFLILRYRLFLSLRRRSPNMADCPPASGERELGLDRRETSSFYPADEFDIATVMKVSTRETLRSDIW